MIAWHISILSLFIIYVSYIDYQKLHSNANDVQSKIDSSITRLAREAGVNEKEIKQKYFVKRQAHIENARTLKTSTKFK